MTTRPVPASRCSVAVTTATPSPSRAAASAGEERAVGAGVAADEVAQRVGDRLGEHLRHPDRQRRAERVAQPAGVLDRDVALLAGDADLQRPAGGDELVEPRRRHAAGGRPRRR